MLIGEIMKKIIAIFAAALLVLTICVGVASVSADENYEDHSWEGDSPNAQGDPQDPDDTGGSQQREEPRTRNKDN